VFTATLRSEWGRIVSRRSVRALLLLFVVLGALAALLPVSSDSTAYGTGVVAGFVGIVVGVPALAAAAYLGALLGSEDHELGTGTELYLAGLPRRTVALVRLILAVGAVLLVPLLAMGAGAIVACGHAVADAGFGADTGALRTGFELRVLSSTFVGASFSGLVGLALASLSRSRLAGFAGWLGLLILYIWVVPIAFQNRPLALLLRTLPFGPYLNAVLGADTMMQRNLHFDTAESAVTLAVWAAVTLLAYMVCLRREVR
jgi:hypothetical protein